jgi:hypothetical protein
MWTSIQCKVSNTLQNWNLQRPYSARLDERIKGFTEEWDGDTTPSLDVAEATIQINQNQECTIRLFQYRPAWFEQLVLRVSRIPHVVINSAYAVTEVTGPLPMLQDFTCDSGDLLPAMIGRHQPSENKSKENSILAYLKQYRKVDLDHSLISEEQIQQSMMYTTIIENTLTPCLMTLRYHGDPVAWEQIYRPQCVCAMSGSANTWLNKPFLASWQAWSERVQAVSKLSPSILMQSKEEVIETVRCTYSIFEYQIKMQHSSSKCFLLGTDKPTTVDCLLWDHLMMAMADIHLVILLADFPGLLQFTQHIWDSFSFGTTMENISSDSVWVWNLEENALNAFTGIPLLPKQSRNCNVDTQTMDVLDKLSPFQDDLRKSLKLAKKQRSRIPVPGQHRNEPFSLWHHWRMGGGYYPKSEIGSDHASSEDQIRLQYQKNDEIWIAGVITTTVLAMLCFGLAG